MLPEAGRTGAYVNIVFACLLTKHSLSHTKPFVCLMAFQGKVHTFFVGHCSVELGDLDGSSPASDADRDNS